MHKFVKLSVLPVAALAVACGRGKSNDQQALNADLKRDLQAASASGVELASTAREYQPTRFVSAIESPKSSAPVRRRNVRRPARCRFRWHRSPVTEVRGLRVSNYVSDGCGSRSRRRGVARVSSSRVSGGGV